MRRVPELDGLRGIAATGVVAFHWVPVYTFWMWSFVDLFFVLSGYLISRILLESLLEGRFSLSHFWMRRVLRIWPVYYVTLLGVTAFLLLVRRQWFVDSPFLGDFLRSLTYLQFTPLYFHGIGDPWAMFYFLPGMLHSWSVAVEEQFYMLWPLLLALLLPRLGLRRLGWLLVSLAVLGPVFRAVGFAPVLLLSRVDGLALGVLLAVIVTSRLQAGLRPAGGRLCIGYAAALVVGLAAATPYLVHGYRHPTGPAEIFADPLLVSDFALFYFGLIGLAVAWQGSRVTAVLRSRLLTYLGSISYAMYMFHFPILEIIAPRIYRYCGEDHLWLANVGVGVLVFGLPHLSRELLERPILAYKNRFPNKQQPQAPRVAQA